MSEKKYLLTPVELDECVKTATKCGEGAAWRWLEAHEYRERTCYIVGVRHDRVGECFELSCGHDRRCDGEGEPPRFCEECGAKVVGE